MSIQVIRTTTSVRWKRIEHAPDYLISNTGLARKRTTILKPIQKKVTYYLYIVMYNPETGKRYRTDIHRLVWDAFGYMPHTKGFEIHHKDRDINNNHIDNLCLIPKEVHNKVHHKKYPSNSRNSLLKS